MTVACSLVCSLLDNKVNEKNLLASSNHNKFLTAFDVFIGPDGRVEHLDANIIIKLSKKKRDK